MDDLWNFADINKHPMAPCDLHRLLDRKFSASTFARDVSQNLQSTRKTLAPTEYNQAYDTSEAPSLRNGKLSSVPVSLCAPLYYCVFRSATRLKEG